MRFSASMVYDIVLMAIFVFIVWRGWRQGALSAVVRLAGWAAALILVAVYSRPWAEQIYHTVVEQQAINAVTAAIPAEMISAMESGAIAVQSIQEVLNNLTGIFGGQVIDNTTANSIIIMLQQDAGTLAQIITQTVLQPMLVSLIQAILSILMVVGCLCVSRLLARLLRARGGSGILSLTNRFLGAGLGVGEGLVTAYAYVFVLSLLAAFISTGWFSRQILMQSVIVRLFL